MLSSLSTFSEMRVTRQQYKEDPSRTIILKKG